MKNYEFNFNKAMLFSAEITTTEYTPVAWSFEKLIPLGVDNLINKFLSQHSPSEACCKCLDIHQKLKNYLIVHSPHCYFMTFGYVKTGDEKQFEFGHEDIKSWIKSPNPQKNKNYHCWLTLQSMEIIDISLPTSIMKQCGEPIDQWRTVEAHPDELPSWEYYPVFVGEDVAKFAGLLI